MSYAETLRRTRIGYENAIAEAKRRLENVRYYVKVTARGGAAESSTAHTAWLASEAELMAEITAHEQALKTVK